MVKKKKDTKYNRRFPLQTVVLFLTVAIFASLGLVVIGIVNYKSTYKNKVYPGVKIDGIIFGGKTQPQIEHYFEEKSRPLSTVKITLAQGDQKATISGETLAASFDGKLLALQAYSIGRSGHILSDMYQTWRAKRTGINLHSTLKMNTEYIDDTLDYLAVSIDTPTEDALFNFEDNKVTLFKPSKIGRKLNIEQTKSFILSYITSVSSRNISSRNEIIIQLPVDDVIPNITTESSNTYGIKELLAKGTSKFAGSIAGRIHNIELAASKLNGKLVAPGDTFSFNGALGDVSIATGFQTAYIIKDGRTILGDGGGVCQVSTTLFRAALNTGLPIVERHPHSYRVSYYEQDSGPGLDATVFAPSYDLKFKNDTANYILIQSTTDRKNQTLTFDIYGTSDGRKAEVAKPVILSSVPPPPDLYEDDPTLAKGAVKQVDWKAWGAKVYFNYKVTKEGHAPIERTFYSTFQPWQSVFLRGTKE